MAAAKGDDHFVKVGTGGNSNAKKSWLQYEFESLKCLYEANALTKDSLLKVPKPLEIGINKYKKNYIKIEKLYLNDGQINYNDKMRLFGKGLAQLHLVDVNNIQSLKKYNKFGFFMDGCIGDFPQLNLQREEKEDLDWVEFYKKYRLQVQLDSIKKIYYNDEEIISKMEQLIKNLKNLIFDNIVVEDIKKSVVHGDLWSGNYSYETKSKKISIYDPACSISCNEFEFGMISFMGGVDKTFYDEYFKEYPSIDSTKFNKRLKLYELYHHLNHYNIFGSSYRNGCIQILNNLLSGNK